MCSIMGWCSAGADRVDFESEMIVDFWMPNKAWEGCNVSDPSARVLSNYGDSGK